MRDKVRASIERVNTNTTYVKVNVAKHHEKVLPILAEIEKTSFDEKTNKSTDDIDGRLWYITVIVALHFCNWPIDGFAYDTFSTGLNRLQRDDHDPSAHTTSGR